MALERRGTRCYLYRHVRRNGRVERQYCAAGEVAEALAWLYEHRRDEAREAREAERRVALAERDRQEDLERQIVVSLDRGVDFFCQAMTVAGFYQHKREWRKMGKQHIQNVISAFNYEVEAEKARRLFDEDKDGALVEKYGGDVAQTALETLIGSITSDPFRREALRRYAAKLRSDLAGDNPTVIERLLVRRIVLAWLDTHHADVVDYEGMNTGERSLAQGDYYDRRRDRAQRRLLQAVRALETVRRKALADTESNPWSGKGGRYEPVNRLAGLATAN